MANTNGHFFTNDRVQQVAIQFAFKIPTIQELTMPERKTLESVLSKDKEVFQLFNPPNQKGPVLFQVLRQVSVDALSIQIPSFSLTNDSFSFVHPIKILKKTLKPAAQMDGSDKHRDMMNWFSEVQKVLSNARCLRTGKIYELVLGPFSPGDKEEVLKELFKLNLSDIGEIALTFANYVTQGSDIYNIQTSLQYMQLKLEDQFVINARVDINNRELSDNMEPGEISKVWKFADEKIDAHLKGIFNLYL